MKEVPESSITSCIRQGNTEMLPIFLEKSSIPPQVLMKKAMDFQQYQCFIMILSFYPSAPISEYDVSYMVQNVNPLSKNFEFVLDKYLEKGNKISFSLLERVSGAVNERLRHYCAPHNEQTEKILELTANAFAKTNQIHSFELLTEDFDVELFIRNGKHPEMAAKLIQSVEEYSIINKINKINVAILFSLSKGDANSPISSLLQEINRKIVDTLLLL